MSVTATGVEGGGTRARHRSHRCMPSPEILLPQAAADVIPTLPELAERPRVGTAEPTMPGGSLAPVVEGSEREPGRGRCVAAGVRSGGLEGHRAREPASGSRFAEQKALRIPECGRLSGYRLHGGVGTAGSSLIPPRP